MNRRQVLKFLSGSTTTALAGCGQRTRSEDSPTPRTPHPTPPPIDTSESIPAPEDYPQYRYNRANTGYTPVSGGPKEQPDTKWKYEGNESLRSPVVGDDAVYLSEASELVSLAKETGEVQWRSPIGKKNDSGLLEPAVHSGTVYIPRRNKGDQTLGVHAFDVETGKHQWPFPLEGFVHSGPTVAHGTVFVGSGTPDGAMYAINTADGSQRWRFDVDVEITPSPIDRQAKPPSKDLSLNLDGVDARTPTRTPYIRSLDGFVSSCPAVMYDTVYFGSAFPAVHALNVSDGSQYWRYELNGRPAGAPAIMDGYAYIADGEGTLYGLDAKRGREVWQTGIGKFYSRPAVAGDILVISGSDGGLFAIDRHTGKIQWKIIFNNQINSPPTIADGVIYAGSNNQWLHAVNLENGRELWRIQTERAPSGIHQSPAVVDDVVYVGTNTTLYAFH